MVYPYVVKYHGVWYPAGAEVPTEDTHLSDEKTEDAVMLEKKPVEEIPVKRRGRKPKV